MKSQLTVAVGCLLACSSFGQGTVLFANRVAGVVDARILNGALFEPFRGPTDGRFLAQLYAGAPGASYTPVGEPVAFFDGPAQDLGYFPPVERTIPGVAAGEAAQVKVVAWYRTLGASYGEAVSRGGGIGESIVITVPSLGGGGVPPAPLEGLQGFSLSSILGGVDPRPGPIVPSGFPHDLRHVSQSFDFYPFFEWVEGVAIHGSTAYVASGYGGLRIFDLREPTRPTLLGYRQFDLTRARGLALSGHFAYLATSDLGGGGASVGLRIVDVSDPARPQPVSHLGLGGEPQSVSISADGRFARVSAGPAGLYIVDVQDPAAPQQVGRYEPGGQTRQFTSSGTLGFLAVGSAGLHVLDLTDPIQPSRLGVYSDVDAAVDVAVRGSFAYVSGRETGLHVVDVADPTQPRRVRLVSMAGGAGPSVLVDRHVYVQSHRGDLNAASGLSVVDVSDPAQARVVGQSTVGKEARDLAFGGGRLWVADYTVLTSLPLGALLRVTQAPSFELTGTLGQPYEIQESGTWESPYGWKPVTEVIGTGAAQVLTLPASASPSGRLIRAVALP